MDKDPKNVVKKAVSVLLSYPDKREEGFSAQVKLIMNSEIDFSISKERYDFIPFRTGDQINVVLKNVDCCYSYTGKCNYLKNKAREVVLSISFPGRFAREQNRMYIRAKLMADMTVFSLNHNVDTTQTQGHPQHFSVESEQVKTVDISAGGVSFLAARPFEKDQNVIVFLEGIDRRLGNLRQLSSVVRCQKTKDGYITAVQFIDLPFAAQEELNHFVFDVIREEAKKRAAEKDKE